MMKLVWILMVTLSMAGWAEGNRSATPESNSTLSKEEKSKLEEQIRKQMEREKKYAQEQKFYQGKEYDLDAHKVDPKVLEKVPAIEPEYDFDMTDVYSD
jgi:Flp pilus assembly protein TadB